MTKGSVRQIDVAIRWIAVDTIKVTKLAETRISEREDARSEARPLTPGAKSTHR